MATMMIKFKTGERHIVYQSQAVKQSNCFDIYLLLEIRHRYCMVRSAGCYRQCAPSLTGVFLPIAMSHAHYPYYTLTCLQFIQGVTGGMCETSGECSLC